MGLADDGDLANTCPYKTVLTLSLFSVLCNMFCCLEISVLLTNIIRCFFISCSCKCINSTLVIIS